MGMEKRLLVTCLAWTWVLMRTGTWGFSLPPVMPYPPNLQQYFSPVPGNIFPSVLGMPQPMPGPGPRCLVIIGSTEVTRPTNTYGPPSEVVGRQLCVTREMVNDAFTRAIGQAGTRSIVYNASDSISIDAVGSLGEAIYATAQALARKLGLSRTQAAKDLALIPTEETEIGRVCPVHFRDGPPQPPCPVSKYRSYDGWCNNLQHPGWGASLTIIKRFVTAFYKDGLGIPLSSAQGNPLPNPREVSWFLHQDPRKHERFLTTMFVAWGQYIDHDIVNAIVVQDASRKDRSMKCCPDPSTPQKKNHPDCWNIDIDRRDPFYSKFGETCMNFVRSRPGVTFGCRLGPREQINEVTSYVDGSQVYGPTRSKANSLRSFKRGQLKVDSGILGATWKPLLPLRHENPDVGCSRSNDNSFCFDAGDGRANQQTLLMVMHTLFLRYHNDLAVKLSYVNPHWDDERLFQEARRIVIATIQHVTYNEFLPTLLGKKVMDTYGLTLEPRGYWRGYDPSWEAVVWSEFATAAFRVGHTFVPSEIHTYSYNHRFVEKWQLRDLFNKPWEMHKGGRLDNFALGMANQPADAYDSGVNVDLGNYLFQAAGKNFGHDLAARNIHRGRDHGLRGYVYYRRLCGLSPVADFADLYPIMQDNQTAYRFSQLYKDVRHIDLWSGIVSEKAIEGAAVGPTIACLIGNQFKDLRWGDRFWYENPGWPSSFSLPQLDEIRKVSLAGLVCEQGDHIAAIQRFPMQLPNYEWNRRVSCTTAEIPRMDLRKWKEVPRYPVVHPPGFLPPPGYV